VKRASPDGYTLLVTSLGPLVIAPHLIKNLPNDPNADFDLLTLAVQVQMVAAERRSDGGAKALKVRYLEVRTERLEIVPDAYPAESCKAHRSIPFQ
jgi:hypothetical protein